MKRRSRASGKPAGPRRPKSSKSKGRAPTKATSNRTSGGGAESEVVQLRRELHEALAQQTATSEVLKAISRSTFDLQKVLDTLSESACRLCVADKAAIWQRDGELLRMTASYGVPPEGVQYALEHPLRPGRSSAMTRAASEGKAVHIADALADPEYAAMGLREAAQYRTALGVPLMGDGAMIGAFALTRTEVNPFTDKQIELVKNFAAQAVIAIENARLLNELRESLEQQTAATEVLGVINSSAGDLTPVFEAILDKAHSLCGAERGTLFLYDGDKMKAAVAHGYPNDVVEYLRTGVDVPPHHATLFDGKHVHIPDLTQLDSGATGRVVSGRGGVRTNLIVPLFRNGELLGMISCNRTEVRPFSDKEIALIESFAAQAVIAIENARLFSELRELNSQLEQRVSDQVGEIERMGRLRRFLPPQVADLIIASGTEKQLESHRREITALFCDLRGFTGFTETADAEDVIALLREYHAAIGEKIIKYSGTLERYAGDGVMVVFNDPVPVDNPALQAVLMALEMRETIGALTGKWRRFGHDIGFGIGIAHGYATLGTIGFEGRFDYAAIGTVSNVASRLCDEAKPGQILISPRVLVAVEDTVKVEPVGEFELKGIRRPLAAYNVLSAIT
jgi:class 3 adenylate cyclase/putative methionine-R-sulfoxide reductase with GAF domain